MHFIHALSRTVLVLFLTIGLAIASTLNTDILIVGAGPAGLTLGNVLHELKQDFIIIESRKEINPLSKATGIHINSLQLLNQLELANGIINKGNLLNAINNYKEEAWISKTLITQGETDFEKNISISQPLFEAILSEKIKGVTKRGWKLVSFESKDDFIYSTIQSENTHEDIIIKSKYLIGSDGSKSTVRNLLGISFEGKTSPDQAFTFDAFVVSELEHNEMHMFSKNSERLVVVPIEGQNMFKFAGKALQNTSDAFDLANIVRHRSGIQISPETISGFSLYHTHSKIAGQFRKGNIFLIGDAAHIFLPAGGYGLNSGIEDAFSLGWRLALCNNEYCSHEFLEAFAHERLDNAILIQSDALKKTAHNIKLDKHRPIENEIQVYDKCLGQNKLSRVQKTMGDLGDLIDLKTKSSLIKFLFHELNFKCIYSWHDANTLESSMSMLFENLPIPLKFLQIKASQPFIMLIRPDLMGKLIFSSDSNDWLNENTHHSVRRVFEDVLNSRNDFAPSDIQALIADLNRLEEIQN